MATALSLRYNSTPLSAYHFVRPSDSYGPVMVRSDGSRVSKYDVSLTRLAARGSSQK